MDLSEDSEVDLSEDSEVDLSEDSDGDITQSSGLAVQGTTTIESSGTMTVEGPGDDELVVHIVDDITNQPVTGIEVHYAATADEEAFLIVVPGSEGYEAATLTVPTTVGETIIRLTPAGDRRFGHSTEPVLEDIESLEAVGEFTYVELRDWAAENEITLIYYVPYLNGPHGILATTFSVRRSSIGCVVYAVDEPLLAEMQSKDWLGGVYAGLTALAQALFPSVARVFENTADEGVSDLEKAQSDCYEFFAGQYIEMEDCLDPDIEAPVAVANARPAPAPPVVEAVSVNERVAQIQVAPGSEDDRVFGATNDNERNTVQSSESGTIEVLLDPGENMITVWSEDATGQRSHPAVAMAEYNPDAWYDLVVDVVSVSPEEPLVGEQVTINARVTNRGTMAAPVRVRFFISETVSGIGSAPQVGQRFYEMVGAGDSVDAEMTGVARREGMLFAAAQVSSGGVPERATSNNLDYLGFYTDAPASPTGMGETRYFSLRQPRIRPPARVSNDELGQLNFIALAWTQENPDAERIDHSDEVSWYSSIDGYLGTGHWERFPNLSTGFHTIAATMLFENGSDGLRRLETTVEVFDPDAGANEVQGVYLEPSPLVAGGEGVFRCDVRDPSVAGIGLSYWSSDPRVSIDELEDSPFEASVVVVEDMVGQVTLGCTASMGDEVSMGQVAVLVNAPEDQSGGPPIVEITNPTEGETFAADVGVLELIGEATSSEGGVLAGGSERSWYVNGVWLAEGETAMLEIEPGDYVVTYVVSEPGGGQSFDDVGFTVTGEVEKELVLTTPASGAEFSGAFDIEAEVRGTSLGVRDASVRVMGSTIDAYYPMTVSEQGLSVTLNAPGCGLAESLCVLPLGEYELYAVAWLFGPGVPALASSMVDIEVCEGESCGTGPEDGWIEIPAGTFTMGSPEGELGRIDDWEDPPHSVTITRSFYLSAHEITQGEWESVMGSDPSYWPSCGDGDNCPVERVSWWDVLYYLNELSEDEGLQQCYTLTTCSGTPGAGCDTGESYCLGDYTCESVDFAGLDCTGYRLPTEAEWEYAIRAETTTAYHNGTNSDGSSSCANDPNLDLIAWYCDNSGDITHPVEGLADNDWGLYDMSGNVWEWTWDTFDASYYSVSPDTDPLGPSTAGSNRVIRGGSWDSVPRLCRSAMRSYTAPADRNWRIGARSARSVIP